MSLDTNTPPSTTGYLLLFRNNTWDQFTDGEAREVMEKVHAWFDELFATGKVLGAQPLFEEGTYISGKGGRSVTDAPLAEAKEAIGGYVLLSVDTKEEAIALAKSNPMHDYGLTTEIRPVASSCPHLYRLNQRIAEAVAV